MKKIYLISLIPLLFNINIKATNNKEILSKSNKININLKSMELKDFIILASKILNKNIISKEILNKNIKFYSAKEISEKNFNNIIASILNQNDLLLIEKKDYIELISKQDYKNSAPELKINLKNINDYSIITYPLKCGSYKAQNLKNKLFYFTSKIGKITIDEINNQLLITDFTYKIKQIKKISDLLNNNITIIPNQIILSKKLDKELYKIILKYASYISFYRIKEKFELIPNYKNNSITIMASKKFINEIKKYIKLIENNKEIRKTIKVYPLKNALAENTIETLKKLINIKNEEKDIKITIDKELNSIIVYSKLKFQKEIKNLIKILDIPRKQVYVKASIIEINEGKLNKLGIKYGIDGLKATSNGLISLGTNLTGNSLAGNIPNLIGNTFNNTNVKDAFLLGLSVEFLKNKNIAEIISEPSILCVNNKESNIYVGETESILNSTSTPTTGGIVKNFSREDIGLLLKIKPRILQNNKINMDISIKLEGIVRQDTAEIGTPTTTKREINTNAIISNGKNVIIGGLIKKEQAFTINKIPLLSDIPYLGKLFTYQNKEKKNTSLVIVLTPFIINNQKDFEKIKEKLGKLENLKVELLKKIKLKPKKKKIGNWDDF